MVREHGAYYEGAQATRSELKKKAAADELETMKDLICLLSDTSLPTSGCNLDVPMQFVDRIHSMIKLGLSIDDDDGEGLGDEEAVCGGWPGPLWI